MWLLWEIANLFLLPSTFLALDLKKKGFLGIEADIVQSICILIVYLCLKIKNIDNCKKNYCPKCHCKCIFSWKIYEALRGYPYLKPQKCTFCIVNREFQEHMFIHETSFFFHFELYSGYMQNSFFYIIDH
jgi:hypothetical protein